MTLTDWESEIGEALEGSGWVGTLAGLIQDSSTVYFTAIRPGENAERYITISREHHYTPELRREEIRTQLGLRPPNRD